MEAIQQTVARHREHGVEAKPIDIRLIQEGDIRPWMVELAQRRYPYNFDIRSAEGWVRNIVLRQPMVFLPIRTDHAFLVAILACIPWKPVDMECNVALVCADDGYMWEAMALIRDSIEWAKQRGCAEWHMSSETAYDLGPIAKRVSADVCPPRYLVRLR
ncbi:MAG TPA: hypothetical protein VHT52_01710 [Stellaceae bacterium]|nr:hypothetical protein [Stellaceae bacterium]